MKSIIIFLLLIHVSCFAQEKTQLDRKYLTALVYLKTNKEIKDKIIKFQKHWTKDKRKEIKTDGNFNLSKHIVYLPIPTIGQSDIKLLENNYFDPIELKEIDKLIPINNSKFYLFYSKPIRNYLVAELLLISTENEMDALSNKQGPAMNILFVFDEDDIVENAYISQSYYN